MWSVRVWESEMRGTEPLLEAAMLHAVAGADATAVAVDSVMCTLLLRVLRATVENGPFHLVRGATNGRETRTALVQARGHLALSKSTRLVRSSLPRCSALRPRKTECRCAGRLTARRRWWNHTTPRHSLNDTATLVITLSHIRRVARDKKLDKKAPARA